jgi:hypothetical protein
MAAHVWPSKAQKGLLPATEKPTFDDQLKSITTMTTIPTIETQSNFPRRSCSFLNHPQYSFIYFLCYFYLFCSAAIAARLPKSALRRDWMALKLVKERAAAAAFARRQLAKSQKEKEQKKGEWKIPPRKEIKVEKE